MTYSKEVVLTFRYPLLFDQIYVKINKFFLSDYRSKNKNKNPNPFLETYNEMGFRLARIDIPFKTVDWTLFTLPPDSNA